MLDLYRNIKAKRLEKGWSQSELAQKIGYSDKSMIARIENGKIDLSQSKIRAFATIFNCSPSELMGWNTAEDKTFKDSLTPDEVDIIKRYRSSDEQTKEMVNRILLFTYIKEKEGD